MLLGLVRCLRTIVVCQAVGVLECYRLQAAAEPAVAVSVSCFQRSSTKKDQLLHRQVVVVTAAAVGAGRTAAVLADASNCLQGSVELKLPDSRYAAAYELKPGSFNQAASDPEVARHMDECLTDWCRQVRMQQVCSPLHADAPCWEGCLVVFCRKCIWQWY